MMPKKMKSDDPAFEFVPWANPPCDPRTELLSVKVFLNQELQPD
jgi:hypothetical protein